MVQSPVEWVITSIGLAPSRPAYAFHPSRASGARHATNNATFDHRIMVGFSRPRPRRPREAAVLCDCEFASKILPQIHARIKRRDLVIPIEHQGGALQKLAQPALRLLAPAGMIHVRVYVGIKPVLVRSHPV